MKDKVLSLLGFNSSSKKKIDTKQLLKENAVLKKEFALKALEFTKTRRSIRKFSTQTVSWERIFYILEAAFNAPAAGGVTNYSVIVVSELNKRKEIGKLAFEQFWIGTAPVVLVVVREDYHIKELYPFKGDLYSIQNVSAFIENILLLAHMQGLGACWVGALGFNEDKLKSLLSISSTQHVDAIIPIGFADENPSVERETIDNKIFFQNFGNRIKSF